LNSGAAEGSPEQMLARQRAYNAKKLEKILQVDRHLSQRLGGAKSVHR
jgi:hypothetical protein